MLERISSALLAALLACLASSWLASSAASQTYRVVGGSIDREGEPSIPLWGEFDLSLLPTFGLVIAGPAPGELIGIDDFSLQAGDRVFEPREPVRIGGRPVLELRLADLIRVMGDDVVSAFFQASGELVESSEDEVTYRYFDFRADAGSISGEIEGSPLPRNISLHGTLDEVLQSYSFGQIDCPILPTPLPRPIPPFPGDGVIIIGDEIFRSAPIAIWQIPAPGDPVVFLPTDPRRNPFLTPSVPIYPDRDDLRSGGNGKFGRRDFVGGVSGGYVELGADEIRSHQPAGSADLVSGTSWNRLFVTWTDVSGEGAELIGDVEFSGPGLHAEFDELAGTITIVADGDILIVGGSLDAPGFTSITVESPGRVTIEGDLELPPEITLQITADEVVAGGDGSIFSPPDDIIITPPPICIQLPLPIFPNERTELGSFELMLSAAQSIDMKVLPRRVNPIKRRTTLAVIFGREDFDVLDIDSDTLRIGQGEAEVGIIGRRRNRPRDVDRDGHPDLLLRVPVREAEIAIGDTELCVYGETFDGALFEGCSEIDTRPKQPRIKQPRD